ncbi:uncharacterized protein LOC108808781 [Raphanus sativus]|uniref:Uncharacterized protein LOC108808781 n=1 Tax=Raphanus sativus TaxID=3726 RepID=A0A9W3BVW2_RAPSA|nr:uncharacterized protein LOC108808781 [Raphanus sativus]
MSYIPPHKRKLKDPVQPSPFPDSLLTKFRRNIDDLKSNYFQGHGIVYSGKYFTKWFLISSKGIEDEVPPSVELVPLSSASSGCINGLKALVLLNNDFHKESEEEDRTRWLLVAEKVADDLVFAYEQANKRKEEDNAKLRLVARFGKIVFYGSLSLASLSQTTLFGVLSLLLRRFPVSGGYCFPYDESFDNYVRLSSLHLNHL